MGDEINQPFLIVGIGASAGGLVALKNFVQHLSPPTGAAFVIVQHMDPTHKSMLSSLLSRQSPVPVSAAEDGELIQPDHVYVIPPDSYLEIEDGMIRLSEPASPRGRPTSIDLFFRSLSRECGDFCAAIILSGSGSDGTAGARAIKAGSGLVLAQEPDTAEHDAMPRSAIDAGLVDMVLDIEKMPNILQQYAKYPLTQQVNGMHSSGLDKSGLDDISAILSAYKDFNIGHYKPSTVRRRVARRMSLTHVDSVNEYVSKLRTEERERDQLTRDLLINVTEFFRDPPAFQFLQQSVIPQILSSMGKEETIRVWICGCASGEEAYSVSILLMEAVAQSGQEKEIKIFATDFDEHAIKVARKGIYPENALHQIPSNFLEKYFHRISDEGYYQVTRSIRDTISFAAHNVATDPPFSHMHLICCRNMLIYLNKEVQEKVLSSFYFALQDTGYLFLGSSETAASKTNLFKPLEKKWRIYQKIPGRGDKRAYLSNYPWDRERQQHVRKGDYSGRGQGEAFQNRSELIRRSLLETFLAPGIVVDREGLVVYNHGNWTRYMEIASGEPRLELTQLIIPALRSRMRSALYRVKKTNQAFSFRSPLPPTDDETVQKIVQIDIAPLGHVLASEDGLIGIMFREEKEISGELQTELSSSDELNASQNLEQELAETRQELQNTIEELDTSTEELKASHEEALSTNEELQAANEELEASSEELRSLNEELSTVNAELKEKIQLLQEANDHVNNFFASTNVPTVFLDPDLCIQRYTPAAEILLKMGPQDIGRHIDTLGRDLIDSELTSQCQEVLRNFRSLQSEKRTSNNRFYVRHLSPYRTEDRRIEGVVLVFQDITEIKLLSNRAESRERQQAVVAKLGMMALSGVEPEEMMQQAVRQVAHTLNVRFCKVLQYDALANQFVMVAGVGWQDDMVASGIVPGGQQSQAGFTLLSPEPVIVSNLNSEKRFTSPALLREHGIVSGVSCRINHSDPPYGVIGAHCEFEREFTADDANFLLSIANLLSTALHSREAQRMLYASEQRLQLAREAANLGIHDHDLVTNTIEWDDVIRNIWGIPKDLTPITYQHFENGVHPEDLEYTRQTIERAVDGHLEGDIYLQYRVRNAMDGSLRWVEATGKTTFENGKAIRIVGTVRDITKSKQTIEQLARSEEKLRLAMGTNQIGSFEYYLTREETHWDDVLHRIWGLRPGEKPCQEIFWEGIHPDDVAMVKSQLEAAISSSSNNHSKSSGRYYATYRVINRITQIESWVEASGQVILQDNKPIKMIGMVIDITERMNLERSLQKAVKELQHTDKQKNDFLAILGHELRNPLSALDGSADILATKAPAESKILDIMKHNIESMSKLLDDLLDLNRISENRIELNKKVIDLNDTIQYAIELTAGTREKMNQTLTYSKQENLYISGDAIRLEQVFSNLLVNASKYTPPGGNVKIVAKHASDDRIEVSITDNGIGLKPDILERIFDPFFQVTMTGKAPSGLGIGLALVKKLTELHHGDIRALSAGKGAGSTFQVTLPALEFGSSEPDIEPTPASDRKIRPGLKILLIEDNEGILETMPMLLQSLGCEVCIARNGQEGIALTKTFEPDAMLVDIGLPDMTGHKVAELIRGSGYQGMMIALSGYSHQESREISIKVGFNYHLAKPTPLQELVNLLSEL